MLSAIVGVLLGSQLALGDLPVTLPVRQLALASFAVDERPEWLGKNLVQNRIRNDYEVSVLGIYPAMTKSLIDIVWFPKPDQMLGEGDRLLVLHRDLRRLKDGLGAPWGIRARRASGVIGGVARMRRPNSERSASERKRCLRC